MTNRQKGFTLIEIAIVLVIIGLLLGGILKGQELINSAKVKSLAQDFRTVPVFIYGYQDKFRSLPGDDARVASHVSGGTLATGNTAGNGVIEGAWDVATNTNEACLFWQHVRLAGLAPGSTTVDCSGNSDYWPKNADGGQIGMSSLSSTNFPITGFSTGGTYYMCSAGILGKFVIQLDTTMDNGDPATGSMRAMAQPVGAHPWAAAAAATLADVQANPGNGYMVCMVF